MKWPKLLTIPIFISGVCLAGARPQMSEQARVKRSHTLEGKLLARLDRFEGAGKPATELLLDLAYKYRLPMAIEYVDRESSTRPIKVVLRDKTVGQALATIVATMPGYALSTSEGLVDVYSPHAREDPSNGLNFVVKNYDVDGVDTHQASADLSCAMGREMHPPRGCFVSMAGGQWGALKITLHIREAKVYQILNRIVAQNRSAVWTVLAPPDRLSSLGKSPWYIYPLDPAFKQTAIERLKGLFPSEER
jgi:hypothetical protein